MTLTLTMPVSEELEDFQMGVIRNSVLIEILKEMTVRLLPGLSKGISSKLSSRSLAEGSDPQLLEQFMQRFSSKLQHFLSLGEIELVLIEILICRDVQEFDYYLSRMITKVFTQRREVLRGLDFSIKISDLLECADINEAILRASEKKIHDLGYLGLFDIVLYFKNNFKLKIGTDSQEFKYACEMFEVRHIIVHNGSNVSAKFLAKTQRTDFQVGDKFPLTESYALQLEDKLFSFAQKLDEEFTSHFKLS